MTIDRSAAGRTAVYLWAVAFTAWLAWYYQFSAGNIPDILAHLAVAVPLLGLADERWRSALQRRLPANYVGGALIWLAIFALVIITASPAQRGDVNFIWRWAAYVAAPIAAFALVPAQYRLIVATALIAIPVGLIPMIWLEAPDRGRLSFGLLVIIDLALLLILVYRPDERLRYGAWLSGKDARTAIAGYLLFAAVALPLGLLLGFIRPGLGEPTFGAALARLVQIYFFIALAEELVFRAFMQSGLERLVGERWGLYIAAVIFGLSHVGQAPAPNWRYVVLATGAGLVYGRVFQKTRSFTASALTHVLVDWTWFILFAGLINK